MNKLSERDILQKRRIFEHWHELLARPASDRNYWKRGHQQVEPPYGVQRLKPVLHGWGSFCRHAWGAKRVFAGIDPYVWWTIKRWLHKKQPDTRMDQLAAQYGWHKPRQRTALAGRCDGAR